MATSEETADSAATPAAEEDAFPMSMSIDKSLRELITQSLQDFWNSVSSCPRKCQESCKRTPKDNNSQSKKESVGQEIGLLYGVYLIMNTLIGPGIFASPKGVVAGAGSVGLSLLIWGICGVFSTMAALCFAELRESVRKEGVEYAYITEAFGPVASFVYCWMRIAAAEPVLTAVFATSMADYASDVIYQDCGKPPIIFSKLIAIFATVSLALLNVFSQKLADKVQVLATLGKTVALSIIIGGGLKNLFEGKTAELQRGFEGTVDSATSVNFAFLTSLWAYGGWANVNQVTSGLKKPPRNLPRLVKTVIPLVMAFYVLVVTSYFTVMTTQELATAQAIGLTWAKRMLSGGAVFIIPIGVSLTALGSLNASFLSAGRLSGVASKDNNLPEVTSWVHVRGKTPTLTVYLRLVIAIIMISVGDNSALLRFFVFTVWLFHGMSFLALLILRFKNKKKKRPYKVNLVLPVLVVLFAAWLVIGPFLRKPNPEFISCLVLMGLSLLCYLPSRWIQSRASLPDKFIVWIQLFFRIAPKRELRRKSMMRRMSEALGLPRNSIFIPASSNIATAADPKRFDVSRVTWLETGGLGVPALVRRRPSQQVQFNVLPDDRKRLDSVPNLQVHLSHLSNYLDSNQESNTDDNSSSSSVPRKLSYTVSEADEDSSTVGTANRVSNAAPSKPKFIPIIFTSKLPPGARRGSVDFLSTGKSHKLQGLHRGPSKDARKGSIQSLPGAFLPSATIQEGNERDVDDEAEDMESDEGGEYEVVPFPPFPPHSDDHIDDDSDDSSSSWSTSDEDLRGLSHLFDSSSETHSSDSTTSTDEQDSDSDFGDDAKTELDQVIIARVDPRIASQI